jgi:hypothetical protein
MRYAVRYFRDPTPEPAGSSVPTLFLITKLQAQPSSARIWRLVHDHAARHGWAARSDGGAVQVLEGEAQGARELLSVETPEGDRGVVCVKLRD